MKWVAVIGLWWWLATTQVMATSLVLSDVPSEIDADTPFEVRVAFTTSSKNATYYLTGVFYKTKGSNLFGLTEVVPDVFVPLAASPSSFFPITTSEEGTWSGRLRVKADITDAGFDGEGSYWLRIDRFTGKSSNAAESSNPVEIKLLYTPPAAPTPEPTAWPTPPPTPTPTPKPTATPSSTPTSTPKPMPTPTPPPATALTKPDEASDAAMMATASGMVLGQFEPELPATAPAEIQSIMPPNRIAPGMILVGSLLVACGLIPLSIKLFPS